MNTLWKTITASTAKLAGYLAALSLAGCMQLGVAAANAPSHFDDIARVKDVAYGDAPEQKLDIYLPADAKDKKSDVVMFFYGGRWEFGSKDDYRFVGSTLAGKGYVVVIADYRKYPQVHFPVFVQDGAKALAWTYDHIGDYGGDNARIHVSGHSAGAHIGALLAADASYLRAEGKDRAAVVHDFAGLAGPYAFTPDAPDLQDMFGPPVNYPKMRVTSFIDGKQPPMLLLWGDADTDVEKPNLEKLQSAIAAKGGCVQTRIYPGVDHIGIVAALSWLNPQGAPVVEDLTRFFSGDARCAAAPTGAAAR